MSIAPLATIWPPTDLRGTFATLTHFDKTETRSKQNPYWFKGPLPPDQEACRTNISYRKYDNIPIYDLRDRLDLLKIDNHGFQMVHHQRLHVGNMSEAEVKEYYMRETIDLMTTHTGADHVVCYDLRYRENLPSKISQELRIVGAGEPQTPDRPAWQVHVDQTKKSGFQHVRHLLRKDEEKKYLDSNEWRIRIINAWRPISHPIGDAPLAFCDYQTLSAEDLVATERPSRDGIREIYNVKMNPKHRWYWIRDQTPDEVTLILNWDSAPLDGGPDFCAHVSFLDPSCDPSLPPRRSVEVRAVVINQRTK